MIHTENYFDYQSHYECSGYATAYALRGLGVKTDGLQVYDCIPNKNPDGTVPPSVLFSYLDSQNYKAKLKYGSIHQLKNAISQGVPVVVFVRIAPDAKYYHYIAAVGYDEEYIYTADSLREYKNSDDQYYNRKISITDFENMWSTGIIQDNIFITIGLK